MLTAMQASAGSSELDTTATFPKTQLILYLLKISANSDTITYDEERICT